MPPQTTPPMQPPMPAAAPAQPEMNGTLPPPPTPMPMPAPTEEPFKAAESTPEMPTPKPSNNGHKKMLLNKLMEHLLTKPGRSMHETINGVKSAIGAYKNYSKEWDTLNGLGDMAAGAASSVVGGGPAMKAAGAGSNKIQQIMQEIQAKKSQQPSSGDGQGGPGFSSMPPAPSMVPEQTVEAPQNIAPVDPIPPLIAGQPQNSSFNRPAPVSTLGIYGY